MRPESNKFDKLNIVDWIGVVFCIFFMSGSTSSSFLYYALVLYGVWLIYFLVKTPYLLLGMLLERKNLLLIWFLLFSTINGMITAPLDFTAKQLFSGCMMFSPILFANYYLRFSSPVKLKKIILIILAGWIFFSVRAIIFYINHPGSARILASDKLAYGTIAIGGDYSLAYGSAILACAAMSLLLEHRLGRPSKYVFWIAMTILCLAVVFYTESTVTFVAMIVGVLLTLFFRGDDQVLYQRLTKRTIGKLVIVVVILAVLVIMSQLIGRLVISVAENQTSGQFRERLMSLAGFLMGNKEEGAYTVNRYEIPLKSLGTFIRNPLFGVSYQHGNNFLKASDFGIGSHCEWADALANYGLIGGIPFLLIYFFHIKEVLQTPNRLAKGWIVCFIIMGMFNPFRSFQSHLILFFVLPAICCLEEYRQSRLLIL